MNESIHTSLRVPTPLRAYAGRQARVELAGATVGAAMGDLVGRYPDLQKHLYADDGSLRNFVNLYVNGQDIRQLDGLATPLSNGDQMTLIPAIAGG